MNINCSTKDTLPLSALSEFQGNLKHREEADVDKIIRSIQKHGFKVPFFVWSHDGQNSVLDGHGRLMALKQLAEQGEEIPPLPVVYISCKNEAEAKEVLLKINSQYGKMSVESALEFLGDVKVDLGDLALPDGILDFNIEVDDIEIETEGDDEVPEVEEKTVSQPGEMYELGNSILMCGDSTSEEDVARLMGGQKADLCITDPPYNVAYEGGSKKRDEIKNDKQDDNSFYNFLLKAYANIKSFVKSGGSFYIWHADVEGLNFRKALKDAGLTLRQTLIWNKSQMCFGRSDYQWKHEPCLYGWIDGSSHAWYSDRKQTTVIDCKRPTKALEHPTMKPVELFEYQIGNSTKAEDIVLDLFGGSGTTLIAAEKLNRRARIMELDPHYCDVIRRRYTKWAKENGKPITSGCLE